MKKLMTGILSLLLVLLATAGNAQTTVKNDYFAGKWNVKIEGTPNGDVTLQFDLTRKDSGVNGTISDMATQTEVSKIEKIEEPDEKTIVIYFHAQGYDLNLRLEKKEEDKVEGSLMGMFEAKGERVKTDAKAK